jgi:hypothetical protein
LFHMQIYWSQQKRPPQPHGRFKPKRAWYRRWDWWP